MFFRTAYRQDIDSVGMTAVLRKTAEAYRILRQCKPIIFGGAWNLPKPKVRVRITIEGARGNEEFVELEIPSE